MKPTKRFIALFLAPAFLAYLVFFLYPTLRTFYLSVFKWSGVGREMQFRGLGNFRELMSETLFVRYGLRNTLLIWIVGGIMIFALAFLFTALLNSGVRGKRFFRSVIFLPNVIATIALTTLWNYIYNPRFGFLRNLFDFLGFEKLAKFQWVAASNIFWAMLIALVWTAMGYYLVLLMAGVDRIPIDYYEAAKLDGASQTQMFFRITLPLLWDVLTVALVLWSITALNMFEFPFAFTQLEPLKETYTAAVYLYILAFGKRTPIYRYGKASAVGVILLLTIFVVVTVIRRVMRREVVQF